MVKLKNLSRNIIMLSMLFSATTYGEQETRDLKKIESDLKDKFVGWEGTSSSLMNISRTIINNPENMRMPAIIPMVSLPGQGKSTLIQEFAKMMGWSDLLRVINIEKGTNALPMDKILEKCEVAGEEKESESHRPQGVIVIEDVQNLKKILDIYPEDYETALKEQLRTVEKSFAQKGKATPEFGYEIERKRRFPEQFEREKAQKILKDMLGNGTYIANLEKTPTAVIKELQVSSEAYKAINSKKTSLEKDHEKFSASLREKRAIFKRDHTELNDSEDELNAAFGQDRAIRELQLKIKKLSDSIDVQETALTKRTEEMKKSLNYLIENYPKIFSVTSPLLDVLLDELTSTPENFISDLKQKLPKIAADKVLNCRRLIIIITANPEELIQDSVEKLKSSGVKPTPDYLHEHFDKAISKEKLRSWLEEIFGTDSAINSRLKLNSAWDFTPPLSESNWRKLIQNELKEMKITIENKLAKGEKGDKGDKDKKKVSSNLPFTITFDKSVEDLIFNNAVDSFDGARSLHNIILEMMGSLGDNLEHKIVKDKIKGGKIKFHFPSDVEDKISASVEVAQDRKSFEEKIKSYEFDINKIKKSSYGKQDKSEKRELATRIAGAAFIGSLMFGSVPEKLVLVDGGPNYDQIKEMWHLDNLTDYPEEYAAIMAITGAYAALLEYRSDTLLTPKRVKEFEDNFVEIASRIMDSLMAQKKLVGHGSEFMPDNSVHMPGIAANHHFFQMLANNNVDDAIGSSVHLARELFTGQKKLMEEMIKQLSEKGILSEEEIKTLFKKLFDPSAYAEANKVFATKGASVLKELVTSKEKALKKYDEYDGQRLTKWIGWPFRKNISNTNSTAVASIMKEMILKQEAGNSEKAVCSLVTAGLPAEDDASILWKSTVRPVVNLATWLAKYGKSYFVEEAPPSRAKIHWNGLRKKAVERFNEERENPPQFSHMVTVATKALQKQKQAKKAVVERFVRKPTKKKRVVEEEEDDDDDDDSDDSDDEK